MRILSWFKKFIHLKTFIVTFGISLVWILGSDFIVHRVLSSQFDMELLQNVKGIVYILILSLLLSWLHKKEIRSNNLLMEQKKQAMIGEFSNIILHEVRNPLHSLQICTSRVQQLLDDEGVDGERYIHSMEESFVRLNETIDFLQTLSREGSVENILKTSEANFEELAHKIFKMVYQSFAGLQVELDSKQVSGVKLDMNEGLIGHVLLNLFKNAMEYFRDLGLTHGKITLTSHKEDGVLVIGVANSGKPISSEVQKQLFDTFTTKSDQGGSGLGLVFCRQIMKAHGGRISYDSEASMPKFFLYFPLSQKTLA